MVNLHLLWYLESHSLLLLNLDSIMPEEQLTHLHILKITVHLPLHAITQKLSFSSSWKKYSTYGNTTFLSSYYFMAKEGAWVCSLNHSFPVVPSEFNLPLQLHIFLNLMVSHRCTQYHIMPSNHKWLNIRTSIRYLILSACR